MQRKIQVGVTPEVDWQLIKPILGQSGIQTEDESVANWAEQWSKSTDEQRLLLIYQEPQTFIAQAIDQNRDPQSAYNDWRTQVEPLLQVRRAEKQRVALAEASAISASPNKFIQMLAQHWNLPDTPKKGFAESVTRAQQPSAFAVVAAEHFILHQREIDAFLDDVLINSLPVLITSPSVAKNNITGVIRQHYDWKNKLVDFDAIKNELSDLKEENTLVIENMHHAHEALEASLNEVQEEQSKSKDLEKKLAEALAQKNQLKNKLVDFDAIKNELSDLKEENTLVIKNMHYAQELLELKLAELNQYRQHAENLEQIKQLEKQQSLQSYNILRLQRRLKRWESNWIMKIIAPVVLFFARKKSRRERQIEKKALNLLNSGFFNEQYYCQNYPDVVKSGQNPVEHYLRFGGFEGRNPSPDFDSQQYLQKNPDVAKAGINPLWHYITQGRDEKRPLK